MFVEREITVLRTCHVNAGVLKVKLALAMIGISSIHLLRTFIEAGYVGTAKSNYTETGVILQTVIRINSENNRFDNKSVTGAMADRPDHEDAVRVHRWLS
jgi:hypothetical protein